MGIPRIKGSWHFPSELDESTYILHISLDYSYIKIWPKSELLKIHFITPYQPLYTYNFLAVEKKYFSSKTVKLETHTKYIYSS